MHSIYYQNSRWKFMLLILALIIGAVSLVYTNRMVQSVRKQERKNMELWANATKALSMSQEFDASLEVLVEIIQANDNIPVILTDSARAILSYNNISEKKAAKPGYLLDLIREMELQHPPIVIQAGPGITNYIFYSDSLLLYQLRYYPLFQLLVICVFLAMAYTAFNASRRYEQDFLWVGMAKETAHQLGTPISSLMALHTQMESEGSSNETWSRTFAKDLQRLENITERFSKIGSAPRLEKKSMEDTLHQSLEYLQARTPSNIIFSKEVTPNLPDIPHNRALMEWVIENLVKNAINAMPNGGRLHCHLYRQKSHLVLDVSDTGIGIPRSRHQLIFKPGISTRRRGWGLGLTLARRIVELNHHGSIRVAQSEANKGSTFRIRLPIDTSPKQGAFRRLFSSLGNGKGRVTGIMLIVSLLGMIARDAYALKTTKPLWQMHTVYGLYKPSGPMSARFGTSSIIGFELHRQSRLNPWIGSIRGGHLFGGLVRETNLFGSIATPSGDLITANGVFEDYRLRQFGWFVEGRLGRIVLPLGPPGSGLRIDMGVGMLQHKIWIETPNNNSPQMSSVYKRGYDRLCEGWSLSQTLSYHFLAKDRRINFLIGFDLIQAFTREQRSVRYDTGLPAHGIRRDMLNGIKVSWILPFYERTEKAELYFD